MTQNKNPFDPIGINAEIIRFIKQTWRSIFIWFEIKPNDSIVVKVLKKLGKVIAVILFILLSPVVAVTLFITFFIAL